MFARGKTNWLITAYDFKVREKLIKVVDAVGGNFIFSKAFHAFIHSQPRSTRGLSDNLEGSLILNIDFKL